MLQVVHLQKPSPGQPRAKAELSGKHTLPWMDQGQRYGSAEGSVPFATVLVPSPFLGRRPAPQPHSSSRFLSRFPLLGHRPPKKTLPYLISNSFLFVLFRNWHPNIPGCVSSHGHFFLGPFCSLSEETLVSYTDLCSPGCPAAPLLPVCSRTMFLLLPPESLKLFLPRGLCTHPSLVKATPFWV